MPDPHRCIGEPSRAGGGEHGPVAATAIRRYARAFAALWAPASTRRSRRS